VSVSQHIFHATRGFRTGILSGTDYVASQEAPVTEHQLIGDSADGVAGDPCDDPTISVVARGIDDSLVS
jgi:hypothetical protein